MDGTGREDHRDDSTAGGDAAATLVESALQLRWSAPELALLLADRAAAIGVGGAAGGRVALIAATSLNRLGREVEAGRRSLAGLHHLGSVDPGSAEGDLDRQLRIELATAAVSVGATNAALSALRPVLAAPVQATEGTGGTVRASGLVAVAAALTRLDRADEAARALHEADDLYQRYAGGGADAGIGVETESDPAVLLRGMARAARSAQHRRQGDPAAAEAAARDGLALLSELSDPAQDGGAVGGRLVLELTLSLLDRGEHDAAVAAAASLDGSRWAAAAPSRSLLQLALATRVHLPKGSQREALELLRDAADCAERHLLAAVLAECLEGLCRIHEQRGDYAKALSCLRSAHAAEYRHRQAADALRLELIEVYGTGRRDVANLVGQLVGLIGVGRARQRRDHVTTDADHPVAPEVGAPGVVAPGAASEPAAAPEVAAATVPAKPVGLLAAVQMVSVARDRDDGRGALESAEGGRRARHRQDDGRQRPVAELLSAAGVAPVDGPGRRRAEDRPDAPESDGDAPGDVPAPQEFTSRNDEVAGHAVAAADDPASPPAAVRSLDSPILTNLISEEDRGVGLADLLAGALAAFEEGRRSSDTGTDPEPPVLPTLGDEQVSQLPDMRRRFAAGD